MSESPLRAGASIEDQLSYYKAQYEQLELELQEFQASSKELEAELEKDVEASETRERKLKDQMANLESQVDEWKMKCKQSREEANRAQNVLQKEITSMREANRTLQLKLRDIEVANDDYERQARNTTTSLEDLESNFNIATERAILLEEEVRIGEQERERLRIEAQRLRDELSDLRVEADILAEKLRTSVIESASSKNRVPLHSNPARPRSTISEVSNGTQSSPPDLAKSADTSNRSKDNSRIPPSPPLSDVASLNQATKTSQPLRVRGPGATMLHNSRTISATSATTSLTAGSQYSRPRPSVGSTSDHVPRSESLLQIKGLIGRMQKIEERVQSVRSRLPPAAVTPRLFPFVEKDVTVVQGPVPTGVTVRSPRRTLLQQVTPSSITHDEPAADTSPGAKTVSDVGKAALLMTSEQQTTGQVVEAAMKKPSHIDGPPAAYNRHVVSPRARSISGTHNRTSFQDSPNPRSSSRSSNISERDSMAMRSIEETGQKAVTSGTPARRTSVGVSTLTTRSTPTRTKSSNTARRSSMARPPVRTTNSTQINSTGFAQPKQVSSQPAPTSMSSQSLTSTSQGHTGVDNRLEANTDVIASTSATPTIAKRLPTDRTSIPTPLTFAHRQLQRQQQSQAENSRMVLTGPGRALLTPTKAGVSGIKMTPISTRRVSGQPQQAQGHRTVGSQRRTSRMQDQGEFGETF